MKKSDTPDLYYGGVKDFNDCFKLINFAYEK